MKVSVIFNLPFGRVQEENTKFTLSKNLKKYNEMTTYAQCAKNI